MTSDGGCDAVGLSCLDEGDSFHIFLDMFEGGLEFQELSHIFVSCGGDLEEAIEKASAALLQVCEPPEQSPMREKVEEDAFPLEFHEPAFQEGLAQLVNTFSDFQVPTLAKVLLQCDGNAEVAAHELLNGIVEESERVGVASWSERVKENQKRASPSPSSRSRTAEAHEAAMHIRRILRPSSPPPSSSLNGEAVARRSRTRSCPALPSSSSLRHAAEEEGATMASLFHEASTKYKRSGGSSVVDLSRAGATSRQKMMMLHAMAAAAALQERNPRLRFAVPMDLDPSDGVKLSSLELLSWELARDGSLTCDLHGLTVAEAVSAVHIILRGVTTAGPSMGPATSYVRFVTGQGLHSQGKARLRPVVGRELQKAGYKVHSEAGAWIAALK